MGIGWTVPPAQLFDDVKNELLDGYKDKAIELYNQIIANSPVAEINGGRYRGNHIMTAGGVDYSYSDNKQIRRYTRSFYTHKDFVPITIQNNLPYAYRLEHGWSKQAANGIYAISAQEIFG
ncbi:hypothetical protein B0181_11605 [Moraxella caviae]|uniref:Uncharacterized protein n=1 Tax=Moraxella caviae TaxID=34060 RepID=A0A1S9ZTH5_9GAMM|nr:hypothetical protein [Moraxella caviae]OOR86637.1 hypothetical protein B0181_11605 [Moraxella caviae]STZ14516.1 Uncharacterised protein [Moraxella caviae]VEW11304.1 Uncharacterised protein [Moraxella caviae]